MTTIAIIGSRAFPSRVLVQSFVAVLPSDTRLVSGGAVGVDTWAQEAALQRGLTVTVYRPQYGIYPGKIAPLKRNETIVDAADRVVAFWDGTSTGTIHALKYAHRTGKSVTVFGADGVEIGEERWRR